MPQCHIVPYSKQSTNLWLSCDIQYYIFLLHHHYLCVCVYEQKEKDQGMALSIINFVSGADYFIQWQVLYVCTQRELLIIEYKEDDIIKWGEPLLNVNEYSQCKM